MPEYDVVKKGGYLHPQKDNSIPVDSFLFIRENGKKYLLLSFNNNRKNLLTGLSLEITQLNGQAKPIAEKSVKYGNLTGKPKSKYVLTHKIEIADDCEDVIVKVNEALYGQYAYTVSSGREKVEFAAPAKKFDIGGAVDEMRWNSVIVTERTVKKRIFIGILSCLLIILILVLTYMQFKKFEDGRTTFHYNGVEYAFEDGDTGIGTGIYVIGCGARCYNVTVPAEIEGHPVTKIAKDAFKNNTAIRSLSIESDIPIGEGAFSGCTNLNEINIEHVKNIGKEAFANCKNLKTFTSVNLERAEEGAFKNCKSLHTIDISHDTQKVVFENSVFSDCNGLTFVDISQTIVYPEDGILFGGCYNITNLKLKNYDSDKPLYSLFGNTRNYGENLKLETVSLDRLNCITDNFLKSAPVLSFSVQNLESEVVGNSAFDGTRLTDLQLPILITEVGEYAFRNTFITEFDASALAYAGSYAFYGSALTEFNGTSLIGIGDYAFSACRSLSSFSFGDCSYLGVGAFAECTALTGISYPQNLSYVPESAFKGCSALQNISLTGGRVEAIGDSAFNGCTALKSVVVPNGVKEIGKGAFGNTSLESISVPFIGGSKNSNTFLGYIFGASSYTSDYYPKTLQSVTVTLSDAIPDNGLYGCSSLKAISFPENIIQIGSGAFAYCASLESIKVPDSVMRIGKSAFVGCSALNSISLPFVGESETRNTFLGYVFGANNPAGSGMYVPSTLNKVTVTNTAELSANAFANCYYIKTVDLTPSENLTAIGDDCFFECQNLKYVSLPEGLKSINNGAFRNCIRLSEFTIPAGVASLGNNVFGNCFKLYEMWNLSNIDNKNIYVPNCLVIHNSAGEELDKRNLNGFVIAEFQGEHYLTAYPEGGSTLTLPSEEYGYKLCNHLFFGDWMLRSLTIPACITDTGEYTFSSCTALTDVSFAENSRIEKIGGYAFRDCPSLTKINIPSGVKTVGEGAFENCSFLNSVVLPDGITEVGNSAFYCCSLLASVEFGASLSTIGINAFYGCKNLQTAQLNEGLTSVGQSAFENCTSLTEALIPSTLTFLGARAFAGCSSITKVEIKYGLTIVGDDAFSYNTGLSELIIAESVQRIGDRAFTNISVQSLVLPDSLESIGEYAFANNSVVRSVVISQSLTAIGESAFGGCGKLYLVYNLGGLPITAHDYNYGGVAQNAIAIAASLSDAEYADIDGVTYLRHNADWRAVWGNSDVTSLNFQPFTHNGTQVTSFAIHDNAFSNMRNLKSVVISGAVSEIGVHAFAYCYELQTVTADSGAFESIGYYAFAGCYKLTEVKLPDSLTALPDGIFSNDSKLEHFNIPASVTSIGESALYNCSSIKEITLPDCLTFIGPYAFCSCSGIESIVIPQSVQTISQQAFDGCYNMLIVYNLSDLEITEHSFRHGGVGYYALKVFTDLNEEAIFHTVEQNEFVLLDNEWYLYSNNNVINGVTYLPEIFSYESVEYEYTLKNYSIGFVDGIVIPKSVKFIEPYTFTDEGITRYGTTVYYGGSAEKWADIEPNGLKDVNLYLYTDCVHGGKQWTYNSGGYVSTQKGAHGFVEIERKDATCTEDGSVTYKCNNCDYTYTEELGKTGHKPVIDYEIKPTCTQTGLTNGSHCDVCGETILKQEEVPATGHKFNGEGVCTVCGTGKE